MTDLGDKLRHVFHLLDTYHPSCDLRREPAQEPDCTLLALAR